MNIFSRAFICALLASGTIQPMDWKYVVPLTVVGACFGGGISWVVLSMQNKQLTKINQDKEKQYEDKIEQLTKSNNEKDKEISDWQSETGSMRRKKDQQKENNQDQEIALLKKELGIAKKKLSSQEKSYSNYFNLNSATESVSDKEYILDVSALNKDVLFSVKIGNKIYELIMQSQFYISSDLQYDPNIVMWQAQRGETISKATGQKIRLPPPPPSPPADDLPLLPPLTSPISITSTISTPSGSLREKNPNRVSINPENTELAKEFLLNYDPKKTS